jgi:DNA-directed RNA polymerase subunit N (RpoN/RPB10)
MIIPIRCFTCGKVLADKWELYNNICEKYDKEIEDTSDNVNKDTSDNVNKISSDKKQRGEILDSMGIKKICCRRIMLSTVDLIETI